MRDYFECDIHDDIHYLMKQRVSVSRNVMYSELNIKKCSKFYTQSSYVFIQFIRYAFLYRIIDCSTIRCHL